MKLYLKNKLFSIGGGSVVTDQSGHDVYRVKGKVFSWRKKKTLCSLDGTPIFKVRNKFFNFFKTSAIISDANGRDIATVMTRPFNFKKDFIVKMQNGNEFLLRGSWFTRTLDIISGGAALGYIRNEFDFFVDSFSVDASPENMQFFLAVVIAIDNIMDKQREDD